MPHRIDAPVARRSAGPRSTTTAWARWAGTSAAVSLSPLKTPRVAKISPPSASTTRALGVGSTCKPAVERQGGDAVADDQGQQDGEAAGDDEGVAEPDAPQDALHSRANTCCTSDDRLAPWAEDCRGAGRRSTRPAQGASVHGAGPCHRPFGQPPAFLHGPPACRWHPRGQPPEAGGSRGLRGFRQRQDVPLRLGSGRLIRSWGGCRHDPRLSIAALVQPGHAIRVAPGRPTCAQPKRGRSRASATASPERRRTSSQDGGNERPGRTVTFNSNNPIIISLI